MATKKAAVKKSAPKKQKEEKQIEIPAIEKKVVQVTLEGISPLMVNKFSEKSKTEMVEKQEKKAKQKRPDRDPKQEVMDALYVIDAKKKKYGMPGSGLKLCAVSACRFIDGVPMTVAKGAFHVLEDLVEIKGKFEIDERICRVGNFGNKKPMVRYRPRWDKWSVTFKVVYNSRVISAEQLLNLYENAGFSVGLCEWRPEKSGSFGMFSVKRGR